jgi:hypothetical protein
MTEWWRGIASSEITVDCEGGSHRLRWSDGELTALDHADPAGERALAALGGEPIACIDVLDRWARHSDDLDVLVLASRGPADPLRKTDNPPGGMRFMNPTAYRAMLSANAVPGTTTYSASYRPMSAPVDELGGLLKLGSGLPDRLVATIIAAWTDRLGAQPVPAALHAAMYGRLTAALRSWLGEDSLDVELTLLPPGGQPRALRERDEVLIELPFSWLSQVWARGFAVVAGRFCLAAMQKPASPNAKAPDAQAPNADRAWTLTTIAPDFGEPAPVTIDLSHTAR